MTFFPVIKPINVKNILTLGLSGGSNYNDFLNGTLEEEVSMIQPLRLDVADKIMVLK